MRRGHSPSSRQPPPQRQPKRPPQPPAQPRAFTFTGEEFRILYSHVHQLQRATLRSPTRLEFLRPSETIPNNNNNNNNLNPNQQQQQQKQQYRHLLDTLKMHHFALNETNAITYHRAFAKVPLETAVPELLLAYLLEVEHTCDRVNGLVDTLMERLAPATTRTENFSQPFSPDEWLANLERTVQQLHLARLVLRDIAGHCPLPAFYQHSAAAGGGSTVLHLPGHLQATFLNAGTVADDAQVMLLSLGWFRNAIHFNVMAPCD